MTKVSAAVDFEAPARDVWDVIGDFNGLPRWHPGITASRIEYGEDGTHRVLQASDGGEFVERFVGADYRGRAHTYAIVSGPLPLTGYVATLGITEREGGGATARWECEFIAQGASETALSADIEAFFLRGLANVAAVIAARWAALSRRGGKRAKEPRGRD